MGKSHRKKFHEETIQKKKKKNQYNIDIDFMLISILNNNVLTLSNSKG